jgi:hypothetical protein
MVRIASAFVFGVVGLLVFSLLPPELAHHLRLAVERSVDIQIDRFRH